MTHAELEALLSHTNIPWTYHHWDSPPLPPYGVYLDLDDVLFYADNRTCFYAAMVRLEVYSLERDVHLDDAVRAVLDAAEIPYEANFTYIESEGLYETIFEIEV